MSAPEQQQEARSSVKIGQTAKGDPVVEVKAYTHDLDGLDAAKSKAVAIYNETLQAVRVSVPTT